MNKHITLLFLILPSLAFAVDETKNSEWKGEGELGFTQTSGNTDSESLNAKLGIAKTHNKWTHKARLEVFKTSTSGIKSANRAVFTARTEYKFAKKTYAFGALRYEDDKFSGYDYQSSLSFGLGAQFIKNESHELDASAGLGYRQLKETATTIVSDEAIATGNLTYKYKISKSSSFKEKVIIESGKTNTYTESETSLNTKINGNLASKISYTVKNNSTVPVGAVKKDTVTTIALVYSF